MAVHLDDVATPPPMKISFICIDGLLLLRLCNKFLPSLRFIELHPSIDMEGTKTIKEYYIGSLNVESISPGIPSSKNAPLVAIVWGRVARRGR